MFTPTGFWTSLTHFILQLKCCLALMVQMTALVRLCCQVAGEDGPPLHSLNPSSCPCPTPAMPWSSHSHLQIWANSPQNFPPHPLLHHIPERLLALQHTLHYTVETTPTPRETVPVVIRQLYPCRLSRAELNKSHSFR